MLKEKSFFHNENNLKRDKNGYGAVNEMLSKSYTCAASESVFRSEAWDSNKLNTALQRQCQV